MRLAYVCADPGVPVFGTKGSSVHVQEVVRALRAHGALVELVCARTGGPAPAGLRDVPVHRLPLATARTTAERERQLAGHDSAIAGLLARRGPFDLVYERYSLWSRSATAHAARAGWPCLLEVNAPLVDEQAVHRELADRAGAEAVIAGAASDATAVVCVSDPVAAWVRGHAPAARTVVVPNGVDTGRFRPPRHRPAGPFIVGFVGTLKPWHGVEVLVDAFARLAGRLPAARLLLVGDGPLAGRVTERAAALGIGAAVTRTGAVDPLQVPGWLHAMHVAVAPYPAGAETYFSPLKVYEYLAAGLPVVASSVGQVPAALDHGRAGVLVRPGDVEGLAAALHALALDPGLRTRLGAAARARAVQCHSWSGVVAASLAAAGVALDPADGAVA